MLLNEIDTAINLLENMEDAVNSSLTSYYQDSYEKVLDLLYSISTKLKDGNHDKFNDK